MPENIQNSPFAEKGKIIMKKGTNAYTLTFPKEMLIGLGWVNYSKRKKYRVKKIGRETKRISVKIFPLIETKRGIYIQFLGKPKKGFYLKRICEYRRDKSQTKEYNKEMKEFDKKIKEKQIKNKVLENFHDKLKKDEFYEIKNGERRKISKWKRNKFLKRLSD